MEASATYIHVSYEGIDITKPLMPYLLNFTYTDNAGGKADDISLSLQDKADTWLRDWLPSKGDVIRASIVQTIGKRTRLLPCGSFTIDQIDYSEAPAVFTIKGVSASVKKKVAQQKKSRSWERATLRQIVKDIAGDNQLALYYEGDGEEVIERIDQNEESDLEFLQNLCGDRGLSVKIQEGQLVVYDLAKYEEKSPVREVVRGGDGILSVRFTSKSAQVYKKARVRYHDALNDDTFEAEDIDEVVEGSERELEILERVESQADAERLASTRLEKANRKEVTGSITLRGDVELVAGQTVRVSGYGMFSGVHFITKAVHSVGSGGYTVSLELGQPEEEKKKAKGRKASRKSKTVHPQLFYEGEHFF